MSKSSLVLKIEIAWRVPSHKVGLVGWFESYGMTKGVGQVGGGGAVATC